MLNAIHLLGYAGIRVTGANSYDARVNAALGFHAPDKLVGFLCVGTSKAAASWNSPTARRMSSNGTGSLRAERLARTES